MSGRRGEVGLREVARGFRWGSRPAVPASAEPYRPAIEPREFATGWARTPLVSAARSVIQAGILKPLVYSQVAPRVAGLDALTGLRGPVIFVANHSSHLDAPLVLCSLPAAWRDRTVVTAAADYFFESWFRAFGTAVVFSTVPIDRTGSSASNTPAELLADGWSLVIFPEGTRAADGLQHRFRLGAAYLAREYQVPVVPIGIRGSFRAMPRGRGWPVPGRPAVAVRYGHPEYPRAAEGVREFTARLDAAVRRLVVEDGSTWWDALPRPSAPQAPPLASAPAVTSARWRRVWTATQPVPPAGPRSPWDQD